MGLFGAIIGFLIKFLINKFEILTKKINLKNNWIVSATIFGGVIGILYFIGGPSIQFSGKEGSSMLIQNSPYSIITLIIIIISKLIVTSWSLPAGYRGGLVFPSIFIAVALSLLLTEVHPVLGGPGVTIGATSGMMASMLPPVLGFILIISMIPYNFILVAITGILGAIIGKKVIDFYTIKKSL